MKLDLPTLHHIQQTPWGEVGGSQTAHSQVTVLTPQITGGWKQVRTKICFSFITCERSLSPLHLFCCHSASSLLRVYYAPSPGETKWLAKHTRTLLSFLRTRHSQNPIQRTEHGTHTYRCQPVEQWLQPQATVYSWRTFQSTWSSWKPSREILNRKEQRRGNPHVLQVRTEAHKEGEVTETKDQSLPRLQLSSTELCTSTFNTVNTPLYQSVNRHALQDHFLPLYHDTWQLAVPGLITTF